ncbi:MAG: lysylphosphatidylglycerol synthase domain-containing protein [Longimicrobiales bacterium]|nr:lysylphosphatidylglycerol synthase domain-containing protein [Longimicrobiales bacterium]
MPPTRPTISRLAGAAIALGGLGFVIHILWENRTRAAEIFTGVDPLLLAAALPLAIAGMGLVGLLWGRGLALLGRPVHTGPLLRWYFVGQLGKYLPGGVWPVIGRAELAVGGAVDRPQAYGSVTLSIVLTYLAAGLTFALLLPLHPGGIDPLAVLLAVGGVALVALLLRTMAGGRAREALMRRIGGDVPTAFDVPTGRRVIPLLLAHLPVWVLVGTAQWVVAVALASGVGLPTPAYLPLLGATALSWLAGFLAIPVPGGIGVREAVFVGAATGLPPELAAATAFLSRLVFIAADLTAAGSVLFLRRVEVTGTAS